VEKLKEQKKGNSPTPTTPTPEKAVEVPQETQVAEEVPQAPQVPQAPKVAEEVPQETQVAEKPTNDADTQRVLMEMEMLQNDGRFRVELLHQLQELNKAMVLIAGVLVNREDDKK